MFMLPLFALLRLAEPTPFLSSFFPPPQISSFWGTSIAITPFGTQKILPALAGRKYSIGSSLLTWVQDLGSDHLPILLTVPLSPVFCPNERPSSFNFQKAPGMTLLFTSTLTVLLQRNTRLFALLPLSLLLWH